MQEARNTWNPDREIAIIWSVDDVQQLHPALTNEQAMEVLRRAEQEHDCNHGITWETIDDIASEMFPQSSKVEEIIKEKDKYLEKIENGLLESDVVYDLIHSLDRYEVDIYVDFSTQSELDDEYMDTSIYALINNDVGVTIYRCVDGISLDEDDYKNRIEVLFENGQLHDGMSDQVVIDYMVELYKELIGNGVMDVIESISVIFSHE